MSCRRGKGPLRRRITCTFERAGAVRSVSLKAARGPRTVASARGVLGSSGRVKITLPRHARRGRYTIVAKLTSSTGEIRRITRSVRY